MVQHHADPAPPTGSRLEAVAGRTPPRLEPGFPDPAPRLDSGIRETIEGLAQLRRLAGSPGERTAAEIIARELARRGARVTLEQELVHGTYWVPIGLGCGVAVAAGWHDGTIGALGGAVAAASVADDLAVGRRPLRRVLPQRVATNVVAQFGSARAPHTVVVHAHHDATRTGVVFHPAAAKLAARVAGRVIERAGGTPPPMWGAAAGPAAVAAGAALRIPRLRRLGLALSIGYLAAMVNIALSRPVPGANDNLSAVAVLLALAQTLAANPPQRLRVLLVSTGSEESFLEAMVRFGQRHFSELPTGATTFLCVESVGSPKLMILGGEGLLRLHRYPRTLIEALCRLGAELEIPLHPPFRYRLATDGQVPLRAGYPSAVISSIDWYKAPSNYHWPTDRPENMDYGTVTDAARLASAFIRRLDTGADGAESRELSG